MHAIPLNVQGNLEYASDLYDIPEDKYNYESYDKFLMDYPELENDENLEFCDFNYIIENGVQGIGRGGGSRATNVCTKIGQFF